MPVLTTRRADDTLGLTGLFRRVDPGASIPHGLQNNYPVEGTVKADKHPSPFLQCLQGSAGGRCRTRFRHLYRKGAAQKPSGGLAVGTLNVQGLQWDRLTHRPKLTSVITIARDSQLDILCLSELHFTDLQLQVVYLEEFVLIARGAVGILLRKPFAILWEQAGRPTFWEEASGRLMAVAFCFHNRQVSFGANYSPAGDFQL